MGSNSPEAEEVWGVSHRLLIQCRISCGLSDLTQPEIHMARLYLGGLEPPKPMAGYVPGHAAGW